MTLGHVPRHKPHAGSQKDFREDAAVLTRPRAAIFDNDGLLLDTEEAWTRAEQTLFAARGREFTMEHKRTLIGSSRSLAAVKLEALLERPGEGEALMDELHELVMAEAFAGVQPRPGAVELLARLTDAGIALAVASNSEREFLQRTLSSAGLLHGGPFAAIVSANDVEHPKPAPDIYLEAARRLGVAPGDAVALEDSPIGVASAAAAGMFVIGVPYFAGADLPGAGLLADSLAEPAVARALGLVDVAGEVR
jgi:HAD superfamily hydrolase (TIGR01509 family)